ncbi:MAG: TetR/AcrR family transcriptional regulator [Candidatus Nanopelagicales bacterium]
MPPRSDQHRLEQRARILAAARAEFASGGFHSTSMDDIVRAAGMSPGGVYRYFSGKEELIATIAGEVAEMFDRVTTDSGRAAPTDWATAMAGLIRFVGTVPEPYGRLALTVWGETQRDPRIAAIAAEAMGSLRDRLDAVVGLGLSDGSLPEGIDRAVATQVHLSLLAGLLLQSRIVGDVDVEQYAETVRALIGPPDRAQSAV